MRQLCPIHKTLFVLSSLSVGAHEWHRHEEPQFGTILRSAIYELPNFQSRVSLRK